MDITVFADECHVWVSVHIWLAIDIAAGEPTYYVAPVSDVQMSTVVLSANERGG